MKHLILGFMLSIYQHPTNSNKSIIECLYDDQKYDRLIVDNKNLESKQVETWVLTICLQH